MIIQHTDGKYKEVFLMGRHIGIQRITNAIGVVGLFAVLFTIAVLHAGCARSGSDSIGVEPVNVTATIGPKAVFPSPTPAAMSTLPPVPKNSAQRDPKPPTQDPDGKKLESEAGKKMQGPIQAGSSPANDASLAESKVEEGVIVHEVEAITLPPDFGLISLEERIVGSDVVARVRLSTVTAVVETKAPVPDDTSITTPAAAMEFRFRVLEYLKGAGADELVAVALGHKYETESETQAALPAVAAERDPRWDDREAIIFLKGSTESLPSTRRQGRFYLGYINYLYMDAYTIASPFLRVWLPAAESQGGARSSDQQLFLLEVPSDDATGSSNAGARNSGPSSSSSDSTITLGVLKSRIAQLEAEVGAGDGSLEYRSCIYEKYRVHRVLLQRREKDGTATHRLDVSMESGQPAGSVVNVDPWGSGFLPDKTGRYWLEGADKDLFDIDTFGFTPYDWSADGVNDRLRYSRRSSTVRPLPAGVYRMYPNKISASRLICSATSDLERTANETVIHVTVPTGTVHEAFFDPVTIGPAVGADGSNGVLKPAGFTFGGTTTSLSGLKWESGVVTMTLSPSVSLAGHRAEFIGLDGSLVLTLLFDDAQAQGGTLTWTVTDQPWEDGDLLMLRIEEILPEVFLEDLASSVVQGESDTFTLSASGLSSASSYSIRLSTDNQHLGIGSGCSTVASTLPVPSGASYSSTLTLTGCIVATGTVTATLLEGTTPVAAAAADVEVRASTNVTVTLSPREEERFTYTDIAVEWTDPGACIGDYFVAMYNSGGAVYKNLGSHPAPATTSVNAELGLRWDDISNYELIVRVDCSPSDGTGWRILGEVTLQSGLPSSP